MQQTSWQGGEAGSGADGLQMGSRGRSRVTAVYGTRITKSQCSTHYYVFWQADLDSEAQWPLYTSLLRARTACWCTVAMQAQCPNFTGCRARNISAQWPCRPNVAVLLTVFLCPISTLNWVVQGQALAVRTTVMNALPCTDSVLIIWNQPHKDSGMSRAGTLGMTLSKAFRHDMRFWETRKARGVSQGSSTSQAETDKGGCCFSCSSQ